MLLGEEVEKETNCFVSNETSRNHRVMEDAVSEVEKTITATVTEENADNNTYLECTRLVEGGNVRRFETLATKFDVIDYEATHELKKPLLFYAIEHNDEAFVKLLLEMEISFEKSYSVRKTNFQFRTAVFLFDKTILSGHHFGEWWPKQYIDIEKLQRL